MVETILVSGSTGTVGSEVVKQLSSITDVNIKAAARSVEKIKNLESSENVKGVHIDYNKPESLKEALKDVDKLFLLAPAVPNAEELESNLVNENISYVELTTLIFNTAVHFEECDLTLRDKEREKQFSCKGMWPGKSVYDWQNNHIMIDHKN
jgi:nucleoside-diphosphate-sugar epimerase